MLICIIFLNLKMDKTEEEAPPSTSANPVLELELTEEKLPMTLSRQEVGRPIRTHLMLPRCFFVFFDE